MFPYQSQSSANYVHQTSSSSSQATQSGTSVIVDTGNNSLVSKPTTTTSRVANSNEQETTKEEEEDRNSQDMVLEPHELIGLEDFDYHHHKGSKSPPPPSSSIEAIAHAHTHSEDSGGGRGGGGYVSQDHRFEESEQGHFSPTPSLSSGEADSSDASVSSLSLPAPMRPNFLHPTTNNNNHNRPMSQKPGNAAYIRQSDDRPFSFSPDNNDESGNGFQVQVHPGNIHHPAMSLPTTPAPRMPPATVSLNTSDIHGHPGVVSALSADPHTFGISQKARPASAQPLITPPPSSHHPPQFHYGNTSRQPFAVGYPPNHLMTPTPIPSSSSNPFLYTATRPGPALRSSSRVDPSTMMHCHQTEDGRESVVPNTSVSRHGGPVYLQGLTTTTSATPGYTLVNTNQVAPSFSEEQVLGGAPIFTTIASSNPTFVADATSPAQIKGEEDWEDANSTSFPMTRSVSQSRATSAAVYEAPHYPMTRAAASASTSTVTGSRKRRRSSPFTTDEGPTKVDHRKKRRNRPMQSCYPCHENKRKCDRGRPCGRCAQLGLTGRCVYEIEDPNEAAKYDPSNPLDEIRRLKNRCNDLENLVRQMKNRPDPKAGSTAPTLQEGRSPNTDWRPERLDLEEMVAPHVTFDALLGAGIESTASRRQGERYQSYIGPSGGRGLVKKINELFGTNIPPEAAYSGSFSLPDGDEEKRGWIYGTNMFKSPVDVFSSLPASNYAKQLFCKFTSEVDPEIHAWYTPSCSQLYHDFFDRSPEARANMGASGMTALAVAILGISTLFHKNLVLPTEFQPGTTLAEMVTLLSDGTSPNQWRTSLARLYMNGAVCLLRNSREWDCPSTHSVQAQLLVVFFLLRVGQVTEANLFLADAIKHAQTAGLHIDPSKISQSMPQLEAEIRKRIWWTLQHYDVQLSLVRGQPTNMITSSTQVPEDFGDESMNGGNLQAIMPDGLTSFSFHVFSWELDTCLKKMLARVFKQGPPDLSSGDLFGVAPEIDRIDQAITTWYDGIPLYMKFSANPVAAYTAPSGIAGTFPQDVLAREPFWAKQTLSLAVSTAFAQITLHRPWIMLPEGYRRTPSEAKCLIAAHTIISALELMQQPQFGGQDDRDWFHWHSLFHAAICCAYMTRRDNVPPTVVTAAIADLQTAIQVFHSAAQAQDSEQLHFWARTLRALATSIFVSNPPSRTGTRLSHRPESQLSNHTTHSNDYLTPHPRSAASSRSPTPLDQQQHTENTQFLSPHLMHQPHHEDLNSLAFVASAQDTTPTPTSRGAVVSPIGGPSSIPWS